MTMEQTQDNMPKEVTGAGLPPEVFPYKKENRFYINHDGESMLDAAFAERLYKEQEKWWKTKYKDKVPRGWLNIRSWNIERYIEKTSEAELQENGLLLEAIAAYPITVHPFCELGRKLPLSAFLLAVGFVNSLSKQPLLKAKILENQREMGVTLEVLEEAQKLAAQWESQQQLLV